MKPIRERGFTVIEMVAALAVLSLVSFAGIRAAQNHYRDADYRLLERNAMVLMGALNSYYEATCSTGVPNSSPSISQLVSQGFLDNRAYAHNPFGNDLEVQIKSSSPSMLIVMARNVTVNTTNLKANVGATSANYRYVGWQSSPTALTADSNQYNMQLKQMYEPGVCQ